MENIAWDVSNAIPISALHPNRLYTFLSALVISLNCWTWFCAAFPVSQIVEDYDLPDIRAMKSQYDAGKNAKIPLPMPMQKSPAIAAKEKEKQLKQQKADNLGM